MDRQKFGLELTRCLNGVLADFYQGNVTDPYDIADNLEAFARHVRAIGAEPVVEDIRSYRVALAQAAERISTLTGDEYDVVVRDLLQKSQEKVGRSLQLVA